MMSVGKTKAHASNMDNFQRILSNDEIRMNSERSSASKKVSEILKLLKSRVFGVAVMAGSCLIRFFFSFVRESCYRISTKESPVLNAGKNVLDLVYTCGGKHKQSSILELVYF